MTECRPAAGPAAGPAECRPAAGNIAKISENITRTQPPYPSRIFFNIHVQKQFHVNDVELAFSMDCIFVNCPISRI